MRLILVRHGESVGNSEGRLQGNADYDLTELGQRQALETGRRLAAEGVSAVYASTLRRALLTARVVGEQTGQAPVDLPEVREYDFGSLSGLTYAALRQRFAALPPAPDGQPAERTYPGEEGRDSFYRRVTESVWDVAWRHPGESVAIVSHGGPIALFTQAALGLPYRRPMPFAIDNCSLTVFQVRDPSTSPSRAPSTSSGRSSGGASGQAQPTADSARQRAVPFDKLGAVLVALNDTCHLVGLRG